MTKDDFEELARNNPPEALAVLFQMISTLVEFTDTEEQTEH